MREKVFLLGIVVVFVIVVQGKAKDDIDCREAARTGKCAKYHQLYLVRCPKECAYRDKHHDCKKWAQKIPSECSKNEEYMTVHCPESCANVRQRQRKFTDKSCKCKKLVRRSPSLCDTNPKYMLSHCAKSCEKRRRRKEKEGGKGDKIVDCRGGARTGKCASHRELYLVKCPKECAYRDKDKRCEKWANKSGRDCTSNEKYMTVHCPETCARKRKEEEEEEKESKDLKNKNMDCREAARAGKCARYHQLYLVRCPRECAYRDKHFKCKKWAWMSPSECSTNEKYMTIHCPESCAKVRQREEKEEEEKKEKKKKKREEKRGSKKDCGMIRAVDTNGGHMEPLC